MCVGFSLCFYSQSASAVCVSLAVFVFIVQGVCPG
jgi:hypothetical protein